MKAQDRSYNCGIFATMFLLETQGIKADPRLLESIAGTTPKNGTTHEGMVKILHHYGKFTMSGRGTLDILRRHLPAIVNYQSGGDGHYGTVLAVYKRALWLWDPSDGKVKSIKLVDFRRRWFSKRYGRRWFLALA